MSAQVDLAGVILGVLADTALEATVILAGCELLTRAWPGLSAASRHAAWGCALASLPALAALSSWQQGQALRLDAGWPWLAGWAVGVLVVLTPLVRGVIALEGARRSGRRDGDIVWTDTIDVPLTFARTVFMPDAARTWPSGERRAAHLHESAHVQRGDWWVHVGAWLICALFWFHPLAWWARHRLALEAEHAADDRVLAAGVLPSDYAGQLLRLARGPAAGLSLGQAATGVRIRSILGQPHRGSRRWPVLVVAFALAAWGGPVLAGWSVRPPASPPTDCLPPGVLP